MSAPLTPHKPLRIAILTDDFYPNSGGVARSIELQIKQLAKLGHHVTLLAPKTQFTPPKTGSAVAMPVWRLPLTPSYLCSMKFGKKLAQRISKEHAFDVVHSQNERGAMFLAARIAKIQNIPHVHTFHSNYAGTHRTAPLASFINSYTYMQLAPKIMQFVRPDKKLQKTRLPDRLPNVERSHWAKQDWKSVAKLAQYPDAFTSPAPFMIDNINDANHFSTKNSGFMIPNGIESDVFLAAERNRPPSSTTRIVSNSRLSAEKRVDVIIRAVAELNLDSVELYIFGAGEERRKLQRLAKRIVKKGTVNFVGHVSGRKRIAQELANSDIFVLASYRFDTQGMTLAESACAGLPIVYCDDRLTIGVSPENSVLTTPSVSGITDALRELIESPQKRQKLAAASRRVGGRCTAIRMEERFVSVYRSVIGH